MDAASMKVGFANFARDVSKDVKDGVKFFRNEAGKDFTRLGDFKVRFSGKVALAMMNAGQKLRDSRVGQAFAGNKPYYLTKNFYNSSFFKDF